MEQLKLIGQQIKKYRKAKGMTQTELAEKLGVSTQAVSKWECGGVPDVSLMIKIAHELGITMDTLFGQSDGVKDEPQQQMARDILNTDAEDRILKAYEYGMKALVATFGSDSLLDMFGRSVSYTSGERSEYLMKCHEPKGFACGNLKTGNTYYFVAVDPSGSYENLISDSVSYIRFLKLLGDEMVMTMVMFFLRHKSETGYTTSYIMKHTQTGAEGCRSVLVKMTESGLVNREAFESEEGTVETWCLSRPQHMVSVLILMKDLMVKEAYNFLEITPDKKMHVKPMLE